MLKLAKVVDEKTKKCVVAFGTNEDYYLENGFSEMDVEKSYLGDWYVEGYAPEKPAPTDEEQRQKREEAYTKEVDPITCHINRLKDKEQTEEVIAEIEALKKERDEKVEEIKERYPYAERGK